MESVEIPDMSGVPPASETEIKDTIPTIRAHHLRFVGWAMGLGAMYNIPRTPESVAQWFTGKVKTWLDSDDPYYRGYAEGTVGPHKEHSEEYESSLRAGLREFVDAKGDVEYTIVEEIPDTIICERMKTCGLADHCRRRQAKNADGSWTLLDETVDMTAFSRAAEFLGIKPQEGITLTDNEDTKPKQVRTFTLKAGDIKRVLKVLERQDKAERRLFGNSNFNYKGFFGDRYP